MSEGPQQFQDPNAGGDPQQGGPTGEPLSERPEWLPEKFWDDESKQIRHESLAKSYAELERKTNGGQQGTQETPEEPAEPSENTTPPTAPSLGDPDEKGRQAAQEAGIDYESLKQEFMEKGDLSPESREALKSKGYTDEMISDHIAGQQALAERVTQKIYESAGGQENFQKMAEWARDNLSDSEREHINSQMQSGSEEAAQMAVDALYGRWVRATGGAPNSPNLVSGRRGGGGEGMTFNSQAEILQAMKDPRYQQDEHFRSQVEKGIAKLRQR